MRRRTTPAAALAVVLLLCPGAWAGAPTEQLRGFFAAAARILEDPETASQPEERLTAIWVIAREMFDLREAAQLSLGPAWSDRTLAESEEFVRVFSDLLERSFIAAIAARIQLSDGVRVSFVGESVDGAVATVRTTILGKNGLELPFDYRMIERDGRWTVRDVMIDGVSLVGNYRAQFARVIRASSYGELLQQMQARVPPLPSPVTAATADRHAVAPATAASPPAAVTPTEPAAAAPRQRVAEAVAGLSARGPAAPTPSAPGQQPAAIPVARGEREAGSAAPPAARWEPPGEPAVATARPPGPGAAASALAYWVQVAAFRNLEAAMRLASLLRAEKTPVSNQWAVVMAPGTAGGATLARVRVGPFSDRAQAASRLRDLEALGYKPFIAMERD